MSTNDPLSLFNSLAIEERITQPALVTILQALNFPEQKIAKVQTMDPMELINYGQYYAILQQLSIEEPPVTKPVNGSMEQEIPQVKLDPQQINNIYTEFKVALRSQNNERVQALLNQYQKEIDLVNRIDTQTRQIATYFAIQDPDETIAFQLLQILADAGANINFKDQMKQSILFYICRDGRTRIFEYLIQKGMNVNDQDIHGQTPLFYASRENRYEIVRSLIMHGADVNHIDTLYYQTALFYAAKEGHIESCKLLIDNGCKVNHQDNQKKTALFFARKANRREIIELLNQQMTKMKDDVHKKDSIQIPQTENSKGEQQKQRKKMKEIPKQSYKLLFTDDKGNQRELSNEDFIKFQAEYPEVANIILNADELIDETMVNQVREDETWEKIAKRILGILWKAKGAYLFHAPVDIVKYQIKDYFDIVKKPMDFGTIKTKLNSNVYKSCREFYNDMMLVFENCILYNGTNSEVGQFGVSIKNEFSHLVDSQAMAKYL